MDIFSEKDRIRKEMKNLRGKLELDLAQKFSHKILSNLKKIDLSNYDKIFIYNSFSSEVDTKEIIEYFISRGMRVYLPRVEGNNMVSVEITNTSTFSRSSFGILEPDGMPAEIDDFVAIIPCLAVDKHGYRVGYGGGYYDKFLQGKSAEKIVVCYDFQVIDEIVPNEFDIKADRIITDSRVIDLENTSEKKYY